MALPGVREHDVSVARLGPMCLVEITVPVPDKVFRHFVRTRDVDKPRLSWMMNIVATIQCDTCGYRVTGFHWESHEIRCAKCGLRMDELNDTPF